MMKTLWIAVILSLLLTGCSREFETRQENMAEESLPVREISLKLPEDAVLETFSGNNKVYSCGDYDLFVEVLPSGNLDATVRELTGMDPDSLTVIRTESGRRAELVWNTAGETGPVTGRCIILDDGAYHYCLTALAPSERAKNLKAEWNVLFQSFSL